MLCLCSLPFYQLWHDTEDWGKKVWLQQSIKVTFKLCSISKSAILTKLKIIYYKLILFMYRSVRFCTSYAQANSSWTYNHVKLLWGSSLGPNQLVKLYPPCSVEKFFGFEKQDKKNIIMSLAQFRPEKNQILQVEVLHKILS